MIRITRGTEPENLAQTRPSRVQAARARVGIGAQLKRADVDGYQVAREYLFEAQHRKCAYCEAGFPSKFQPVEHYRPALRADRGHGFPDYGYWWLAWTWENLLFACQICNTAHKGYKFPLEVGSRVLSDPEQPPGGELPVLVDPGNSDDPDPIELIVYERININRWIPTGRGKNPRGAAIVSTLGLHDPAHLDRYADHVNENLMPHIEMALDAIEHDQPKTLMREWEHLTRFARPSRPWAALSFDVIDFYFPADIRVARELVLIRP